jgi:hypothetical protein
MAQCYSKAILGRDTKQACLFVFIVGDLAHPENKVALLPSLKHMV